MSTPGSYSKVTEERRVASAPPTSVAGVAATAFAEANRTTVSISLGLIAVMVAGAFWAGRSSPPPEMVAAQATQNERISTSLADLAAAQKKTAELLDKVVQAQATQTELARTTNTNVEFVSSYYKSGRATAP
jgi:hypothetical protein